MALVNSGGICYAGEKPSALARNRARPGGKGIGRDFRGARDIFGAAPRHLGDWAPVRRSSTSSRLAPIRGIIGSN